MLEIEIEGAMCHAIHRFIKTSIKTSINIRKTIVAR